MMMISVIKQIYDKTKNDTSNLDSGYYSLVYNFLKPQT